MISSHPRRPVRVTFLVVVLAASAAGGGVLDAPVAAADSIPAAPQCAWRVQVSATTVNAALDDADSVYWVMPYTVRRGLSLVLHATFVDARYTSLTAYTRSFAPYTKNGVRSELTDFATKPDAGSVNPWQQQAPAGGRYTATLRSVVVPGTPNVLPIAPAGTRDGTTGYLVYRVYLPAAGAASVALPTVIERTGAVFRTIPPCHSAQQPATALPRPVVSAGASGTGVIRPFARGTGSTGSLFPNPDNGYLSAQIVPPGGDAVVVVRAMAPTTPGGDEPAPWPSSAQVRYWSLCTYLPFPPLPVVTNTLPDGAVDAGCRADTVTARDAAGYFTFVLGTEAQRAAVEAVPGVTFVPFSSRYPTSTHLVLLRNLLGAFPQSVQEVPAGTGPQEAAAVMGDYYPHAAVCPLTALIAGGPAGCAPRST